MGWMETRLEELPPITKDEKQTITDIFERAITAMVEEAYPVNKEVAGALEEGCAEARYILENLKVVE